MKAYIRKSHVYFAMRDYDKALEAIGEVITFPSPASSPYLPLPGHDRPATADPESKHARELNEQERKCIQATMGQQANETDEERLARASRDPEIQSILSDPVMGSVRPFFPLSLRGVRS